MAALREKVPYGRVAELERPSEVARPTETADPGSGTVGEPGNGAPESVEGTADRSDAETATAGAEAAMAEAEAGAEAEAEPDAAEGTDAAADEGEAAPEAEPAEEADAAEETGAIETLPGHVRTVIEAGTGRVRLLDSAFRTVEEGDADDALDVLAEAAEPPSAVVLDGELDQRVLDVAAQRGVGQVVAASTGEFVKKPTSVRVRTADQLLAASEA
jgi:hypothetical protein